MEINLRLALRLARRSLRHHRMVAAATVLGIAIGMTVVSAVLIVDGNTEKLRLETAGGPAGAAGSLLGASSIAPPIERVRVVRRAAARASPGLVTQDGGLDVLAAGEPTSRRGAEDYHAMRLAVRLASLLAFGVGAVIVFYTMRFSVVSRSREFCLLLCLGERRANVALSIVGEAALLGAAGTSLGLLLAFPVGYQLLSLGISTTGRLPLGGFDVPWSELGAMAGISGTVALLGVLSPVRSLYRLDVVDVLQPRFLSADVDARAFRLHGYSWLAPPLLAATYLGARPFLRDWLSVIEFFLVEGAVVTALALATLFWVRPVLRVVIGSVELLLRGALPLESRLAARRMRLTSQKLVFAVAGVTLVFALVTGLEDITRALKHEVRKWAAEAVHPYTFFARRGRVVDEAALQESLAEHGIRIRRLSSKLGGEFPMRLVRAADVNPERRAAGRAALEPGTVIFSRTLAARFGLEAGDSVVLGTPSGDHVFRVIEVSDADGFYAGAEPYVDLKSYALFSDGNPLFADNLETTLGRFAVAWSARDPSGGLSAAQREAVSRFYPVARSGRTAGSGQVREIDRDFLIFDFVLAMTVVLAGIGVANSMLIQVHARARELSVLRTIGTSRGQVARLLLVEGVVVGLVGALLALVLGHALGLVSVSFLDRFTLFRYEFVLSPAASLGISALALVTCAAAALHPALVATRISSAESLHYE